MVVLAFLFCFSLRAAQLQGTSQLCDSGFLSGVQRGALVLVLIDGMDKKDNQM